MSKLRELAERHIALMREADRTAAAERMAADASQKAADAVKESETALVAEFQSQNAGDTIIVGTKALRCERMTLSNDFAIRVHGVVT
jgi:hypothetical protein